MKKKAKDQITDLWFSVCNKKHMDTETKTSKKRSFKDKLQKKRGMTIEEIISKYPEQAKKFMAPKNATIEEVGQWLNQNIDNRWFYIAPYSALLKWACKLLRHFGVDIVEEEKKEES